MERQTQRDRERGGETVQVERETEMKRDEERARQGERQREAVRQSDK